MPPGSGIGSQLLKVAVPAGGGGLEVDVGVQLGVLVQHLLGQVVTGLAAPPGHTDGHIAVCGRCTADAAAEEAAVELDAPPQAARAPAMPAAPATFRKFLREIFIICSSIFLRVFCCGAVAPQTVHTLLLTLLYRFFSKTKWKMPVFLLEKTDI